MTTNPVMQITDEQIAEIEALANGATQGPWHHATDVGQIGSIDVGDRVLAQAAELEAKDNAHRDRNAAYIASVYPQVVIALISRLRAAERDAVRYRWLRQRLVGASFDWDDEGMAVLAFEMPDGVSIGADCDKNIDTAMEKDQS